ncbi:phage tail protein [Xylophilus rhododendri]|uniref:Phage tail protein n=1 Tax=Xylophilus rhododendri TaxID=2697032 RepID=A0A857JFH4_9BURK|nr:phage tail protein [Xylophilus rhododendri]
MAAAKAITGISNAAPAVATAPGHGVAAGVPVLLSSGWGRLDGRVVRAGDPDTNTFKLLGIDTTDLLRFPASGGAGSLQAAASWTEITQILDSSSGGGEQQFYNYSYLEDPEGTERQMPTNKSARSFTLTLGDDPAKAWYAALDATDQAKLPTVVRVVLPSGSVIFYVAYVSFDKIPKIAKNQGMSVTAVFAIQSFNRYAA